MALTRDAVAASLLSLLGTFDEPEGRLRVVGSASSLLRGIDLPARDVDLLARDEISVDRVAAMAPTCLSQPAWLTTPFGREYIADLEVDGLPVQCSTIESDGPTESARRRECVGDTPWTWFDLVDIGGRAMPLVASELRLASDVMRRRPDRWRPIAAHLAEHGFDETLLRGAFLTFPAALTDEVWAVLRP